MANMSLIVQTPVIRAITQEGMLERYFHDGLFPLLNYRGEAIGKKWGGNLGDTPLFSAPGLITPNLLPIDPAADPAPVTYQVEQWGTVIGKYPFATMDTHMPSAMVAIIKLLYRNCHQLGLQAGMSLNRIVRNYLANAAMSGNTVATASSGGATTIHVARLNGFTTARRPDLAAGSPVAFQPVSVSNPLAITIGGVAASVTAAVPDSPADIFAMGPGNLTLAANPGAWALRAAVLSSDRSGIVYGGAPAGTTIDSVSSALTMALQRQAIAQLRNTNVPAHPEGRFHCHLDPTAEAEMFGDPEFQRLNTSLPDWYAYRELALGELQGTLFFRNTEAPQPGTVTGAATNAYSNSDYFGGELWQNAATATQIHHTLVTGQGGLYEYWMDQSALLTEAGIIGKVADWRIVNNGIEIYVDRTKVILRPPINRSQDVVAATSMFYGGWAFRTDVLAPGSNSRYKRVVDIMHL